MSEKLTAGTRRPLRKSATRLAHRSPTRVRYAFHDSRVVEFIFLQMEKSPRKRKYCTSWSVDLVRNARLFHLDKLE